MRYLFVAVVETRMNKIEHTYHIVAESFPKAEALLLEKMHSDWKVKTLSPVDDNRNNLLIQKEEEK